MMLLPAAILLAAFAPTTNGDQIGVATRDRDGRIALQLRSVQCDGLVAESLVHVEPSDADYQNTLRWLGGIEPGETKPIIAKDLQPCPTSPRGGSTRKR